VRASFNEPTGGHSRRTSPQGSPPFLSRVVAPVSRPLVEAEPLAHLADVISVRA
jgi:hypothetical protein